MPNKRQLSIFYERAKLYLAMTDLKRIFNTGQIEGGKSVCFVECERGGREVSFQFAH
jgi:hypothetical protein